MQAMPKPRSTGPSYVLTSNVSRTSSAAPCLEVEHVWIGIRSVLPTPPWNVKIIRAAQRERAVAALAMANDKSF